MKRVEVAITDTSRGMVSEYGNKKDLSMPRAYAKLILLGLAATDVDIDGMDLQVESENITDIEQQIEV